MKNSVMALLTLMLVLWFGAVPSSAAEQYPVSVGIGYGNWAPAMDGYNPRFLDENNPSSIQLPDGSYTTVRVRESLANIDSTQTFFPRKSNQFVTGPKPFLFSSAWGLSLNAKVRLHSGLFALVEYDWWTQEVASVRNYGGLLGYESYEVSLNPFTASLVYELPGEADSKYWPTFYIGMGAGVVMVERTNTQMTTATAVGGAKFMSTGSGTIFTGMAGMDYALPVLDERISLFFEGRFITGTFDEQFAKLGPTGGSVDDTTTGLPIKEIVSNGVGGPQIKFGINLNFGQISTRATKGVLSGLLESRGRRSSGFAMAPSYGGGGGGYGYGGGGGGGGGGFAIVYPQASEQVQVVQGAGMVDEDRIRQIIREELIGARLTAGGDARPVDDLAEQQLRSIRERRLQAERELEQLKELLREEM